MKQIFQSSLQQIIPILISAIVAGGIAFIQSALHSAGVCPIPPVGIGETAYIGASVKSVHTAWDTMRSNLAV